MQKRTEKMNVDCTRTQSERTDIDRSYRELTVPKRRHRGFGPAETTFAYGSTRLFTFDSFGYFINIQSGPGFEIAERFQIKFAVKNLYVYHDEKTLLAACFDGIGLIIDTDTKKTTVLDGHRGTVECIIPCGENDVLTCGQDGEIRRWNRLTGKCVQLFRTISASWIFCIVYDEVTKKVFAACNDGAILTWNTETGEIVGRMDEHKGAVLSIALVNSTTLVSGSQDDTVKIWCTATNTCKRTICSHMGSVLHVSATPDGEYIFSASTDNSALIHRVKTGHCVRKFQHDGPLYQCLVSPDGQYIALCAREGGLSIFEVSPSFSVFTAYERTFNFFNQHVHVAILSDGTTLIDQLQVGLDSFRLQRIASMVQDKSEIEEVVKAVRDNMNLPNGKRAKNKKDLLVRHRLGVMQLAIAKKKKDDDKFKWPREVTQLIVDYAMKK